MSLEIKPPIYYFPQSGKENNFTAESDEKLAAASAVGKPFVYTAATQNENFSAIASIWVSAQLSPKALEALNLERSLAAHVKPEQVKPIVLALQQTFPFQKIEDLTLVTGGRGTSKILKFNIKGQECVIRVTDSTRPIFFIDPASEISRMKIVNKMNVTPKVHYADESSGIIIMDYVLNTRLAPKHLESDNNIYLELAQKLQTLHSGPAFSEFTNVFRDIEKTAHAASNERMPPLAREVLGHILPLEKILSKHQKSAPCHKELNSNNVLYDGKKIYFIDWETAANCDPFVDLAIISNFYVFSPDKERIFLNSYFGADPTPQQRAHLFLMKTICLGFYSFKFLRRVTGVGDIDLSKEHDFKVEDLQKYQDFILEVFNGNSAVFTRENFKTFAYIYLREAMKNIQSLEFKEAIEILSQ